MNNLKEEIVLQEDLADLSRRGTRKVAQEAALCGVGEGSGAAANL